MINADRLLQTFCSLVELDNPSGEEGPVVDAVASIFSDLGLEYDRDAMGNLIARVPGEGAPLLLSAHTDSVAPARGKRPIVKDGYVTSAGDTVLGSDDLAGVAAILEAVRALRESGQQHRAAEIVFTVQEEIGLKGAQALDYSKITAREGIALDLNGPVGQICLAAPAQCSVRVTIHGKAAHAGVAPEQGINAIRVAAEAIAAMPLGRIDAETTANIGVIEGGAATNIVPDRVTLRGEARSRNPETLERQTAAMRTAIEQAVERHGATAEIDISQVYPGYRLDADSPLVKRFERAASSIGLEPSHTVTGGGSDVNVFTRHGIVAANTSIGYEQIHSTAERIPIEALNNAARLIVALLTEDRG